MKTMKNSRRKFIGSLAAGAAAGAAAGITALSSPLMAGVHEDRRLIGDAEEWFSKLKGKHRIVYDAPEPHLGLPFIWSWAFYKSNNQTGVNDSDMTAMVVLRHNAIPFAMEDGLWKKYKFGDVFKVTDNTTGASAMRNPFYMPKEGDFILPGVDGIKSQQDRGVLFCVCDLALSVYSGMVAKQANIDAAQLKEEWVKGVLPGIQVVPSGVWALGRAQENGCGYIYAGG